MHRTPDALLASIYSLQIGLPLESEAAGVRSRLSSVVLALLTTYLTAGMVPKIQPFDIKPTMIKRMNHLVHDRILHMPFGEESVLA